MKRNRLVRFSSLFVVGLVATVAATIGTASGSGAAAPSAPQPPIVFETKVTCCPTILLGGSSNATLIATTPALRAGTYLVHATVGVVMGPNDNVICATAPTSVGGNDGIFGTAGNGATESGSGADGVYGIASIVDTWTITTTGDTIYLYCWVGHYGMGTYADQGVLAAEKVGTLIQGK